MKGEEWETEIDGRVAAPGEERREGPVKSGPVPWDPEPGEDLG